MALFLLCARRTRDNPLRLLILDDPLQNLDELSVTTLSRGLGRLLRLWASMDAGSQPWRVLLTVHGEENMERIRDETPCAAYFLSWLSPQVEGQQPLPLTSSPTVLKNPLQPLHDLVQATPPSIQHLRLMRRAPRPP